jgi:hypothetical protein
MRRPVSSRPRLVAVLGAGLLTLCPLLQATTYMPARIESDDILVHQGHVVFVQPGGSVTVLDAATGAVRLRTPPPKKPTGRYELFRTDAGVLVSAWQAFRMVDTARPRIAWSLEGCEGWFHLAREGLVCVSVERSLFGGSRGGFTFHRLNDGKALWKYRSADDRGGEILDGRGRLLMTSEDQSERETFPAGRGTVTQPVRRVVGVTVLDLASGRELLTRVTQDVRLDGHLREPIRFDGERITYVIPKGEDDSCPGERQRILLLNASATAYTAEDRCAPAPAAREATRPTTAVYMASRADRTRKLPSATVTLDTIAHATLVVVTSGGRRFRVGIPTDLDLRPELGLIREDGGLLLIESCGMTACRLDAVEVRTGRPLWAYVFPSFLKMASTSSFLAACVPPPHETIDEQAWVEIRLHPPGGAYEVPPEAAAPPPPRDRGTPPTRAPVILDPGPR